MSAVFGLFPSITIKALRPESQAALGWIGVFEELKPCKTELFYPQCTAVSLRLQLIMECFSFISGAAETQMPEYEFNRPVCSSRISFIGRSHLWRPPVDKWSPRAIFSGRFPTVSGKRDKMPYQQQLGVYFLNFSSGWDPSYAEKDFFGLRSTLDPPPPRHGCVDSQM